MQNMRIVGLVLGFLLLGQAQAAEDAGAPPAVAAGPETALKGAAAVRKSLQGILPGVEPDSITQTPISGLYEVVIGPQVVYMSEDGRYLVQGNIVDIFHRVNLTEAKKSAARRKALDAVAESEMIVFEPKDGYKHTVTVFTDIDCGYCRKLHNEMDGYFAEGIRVRYLFYPRAGKGSPSYQKAVSVACASDPKAALTLAKNGQDPEPASCANHVDEHMELAELLGVRGTPAIFLQSGEHLPGYLPPKRLLAQILEDEAKND